MDLIVTHINADFDALASTVAAAKIYPHASVIMPGYVEKNVQDFISMYGHVLNIHTHGEIKPNSIDRLILVDTRIPSRIGDARKLLKKDDIVIHIYDHHPDDPCDIKGELSQIRKAGATISIMIDTIIKKKIALSSLEATLFLIGIYEDTGCLTYPTTTPADFKAVSYLLSCKANLQMVGDFINQGLSDQQKQILLKIIRSKKNIIINNINITICTIRSNKYIPDVSLITHKLRDLENLTVLFVIAKMPQCIHIVSRSKFPEINVGRILHEFGGGGHATAASATVKETNLNKVFTRLKNILQEKVQSVLTAKMLMSDSVPSINYTMSVQKAHAIMRDTHHTCLPILKNGKLAGIISSEDTFKAIHHGFARQSASRYMTTKIINVKPDTLLSKIQSLLLEYDIKHMPVIENARVIGMISRTDIIAGKRKNIKTLMKKKLPVKICELLNSIGDLADRMDYKAYVVGGFVRDILLDAENYDIDIVVEGNGISFAEKLSFMLKGKATYHPKFGTAVINFSDNYKIDIATARKEFYESPAALPIVEYSSIKNDLKRRDFTINAMAVSLNAKSFGQLLDFYGGELDLKNRIVRVLYNLSFTEDPTRIFRAIRFEQRYNFRFDKDTASFIKHTVRLDLCDKLTSQRIRDELVLILSEDDPLKAIIRLEQLELLKYIHPKIKVHKKLMTDFSNVSDVLFMFTLQLMDNYLEIWLIYFLILTDSLSYDELKETAERLKFTRQQSKKILFGRTSSTKIIKSLLNRKECSPSYIFHVLHEAPVEVLLYSMSKSTDSLLKRRISDYFSSLSKIKVEIDGEDLKQMGYKPSPVFKEILQRLHTARLDGNVHSKDEEIKFIIDNFDKT